MEPTQNKLYTKAFFLLCVSNFLFSASFAMIVPELPSFLSQMGGADYKGWIIAIFTVSAALTRPVSGKLADKIGRKPIMIFGAILCVICSALYPLLLTVSAFLALRFLHGFSVGFTPTAATAFAADIVPVDKRGEAMGIMGVSSNIGMSSAPILGSSLVLAFSYSSMFMASVAFALMAIGIHLTFKETLSNKVPFKANMLILKKHEIFNKAGIAPAIITALLYFCYGVLLTIVPDQSDYLGATNKGLTFGTFTAFSIISRLVAGRVSDKYGRFPVMIVASIAVSLSLLYAGFIDSKMDMYVSMALMGFSLGIAAPAVFAWAIDRSNEENKGQVLGTVFIGLEVGIGLGALIAFSFYDNNVDQFGHAWWFNSFLAMLAVPYLIYIGKKEKQLV